MTFFHFCRLLRAAALMFTGVPGNGSKLTLTVPADRQPVEVHLADFDAPELKQPYGQEAVSCRSVSRQRCWLPGQARQLYRRYCGYGVGYRLGP